MLFQELVDHIREKFRGKNVIRKDLVQAVRTFTNVTKQSKYTEDLIYDLAGDVHRYVIQNGWAIPKGRDELEFKQ